MGWSNPANPTKILEILISGSLSYQQMPALTHILNQQQTCALNRSQTIQAVVTDHLGNTRALFKPTSVTGEAQLLDSYAYFPFGMQNQGLINQTGEDYQYRYNGKEFSEELGLYDYGARWYDPAIGRWNAVDPLADQFVDQSPYQYAYNNPLRFVDPDGRSADDIIIRTENIGGDGYTEQIRIVSSIVDVTIDLPFSGGFNSLSLSSTSTSGIVIDVIEPVSGQDLDGLLAETGSESNPIDAITVSLGGAAAVEYGAGAEFSLGIFLEGADAGEVHGYFSVAGYGGLEGSAGLSIGFIQAKVPDSQFNAETLTGPEVGVNLGIGPVGGSAFRGFSLFPYKTTYDGVSFSAGAGVKEIPASGSVSLGWAERIGKF